MLEIQNRERAYDGFLKIDIVKFKHQKFDGSVSKTISREVVVRNEAIAALFYDVAEDNYLLVEQIRIPTLTDDNKEGLLIECMAGMIDEQESPKEALIREAEEEVGYSIKNIKELSTFYSTPGGCTEKVILFYAELDKKISNGGGLLVEDEDVRVVKYNFDQLKELYYKNKIVDAKTIIAIQWLLLNNLK